MRVLVAGANGAVGLPLTAALRAAGHEVVALSRSANNHDRLQALGADTVVADVLDRDALLHAVGGQRFDAVVNQLTALKKPPTRHRDMAATNVLRERGTANLVAVAQASAARRLVSQSMAFGYGYGDWGDTVLTEDHPFAPPGHDGYQAHLAALRSLERQTCQADGLEGIALRYGLFYGPGPASDAMVAMLRRRMLPVVTGGVLPFVHVDDAASAAVAALERGRSGAAYNVVDDEPVTWGDFVTAMAEAAGAPRPLRLPRAALVFTPYVRALTGTLRLSNERAKQELGWVPSAPTYREGLRRLQR